MRPTPRTVAVLVAALILVVGAAYTVKHHHQYQSTATLALAPAPGTPANLAAAELSGFDSSLSSGTFADLVGSSDTLAAAGLSGSGVSVTVRADPTARVLYVTDTGPQQVVAPALAAIIRASIDREPLVNDVFRLELIASPSAASASGPTRALLVVAVLVLALLGGLFTLVLLRRYQGSEQIALAPGTSLVIAGADHPATRTDDGYRDDGYGSVGLPPDVSFNLEAFRFIRASATTTLLQIFGYWRAGGEARILDDPVLMLHDGRLAHTIASVLTPGERPAVAGQDTPLWRASYAVPIEIFNRYQRLALRSGDVVVGLPQPAEHLSALGRADSSELEQPHRAVPRADSSEPEEPKKAVARPANENGMARADAEAAVAEVHE